MLLDYLALVYTSSAATLTLTTGIASAEAFGTATLSDAQDGGHASRLMTISGGHVTRPVRGWRLPVVGASRSTRVR